MGMDSARNHRAPGAKPGEGPHVTVILASASPRRRQFMESLGIPFEVQVADVDERNAQGERPEDLVVRLSLLKAREVADRFPQAVVIGADTIVTLDGVLLGKPADAAEAVSMLRRLCGRAHQVYSGVTVCPPRGGDPLTAVVESTVWMRPFTEPEIEAYVASGDPLDKAGAYGIQNASFRPVARLQGCYASVMGLPLCELRSLLSAVGIHPAVDVRTACLSQGVEGHSAGISTCPGERSHEPGSIESSCCCGQDDEP
jgi:septum formation protein